MHMLDSDEEDEGEGGMVGEPMAGGAEPTGGTPTIGDDEDLSNDNENFSHVSDRLCVYVGILAIGDKFKA